MHKLSTSFVLGFHGCDKIIAENLLAGSDFKRSENAFDWLGHGIYFWENNPTRGLEYARDFKKVKTPAVVGAIIDLGLCLDLTTSSATERLTETYEVMKEFAADRPLPINHSDGRHFLDCAVIEVFCSYKKTIEEEEIDTVKAILPEGDPIYLNTNFKKQTHTQICVRNPNCIIGVFRVDDRYLP